VRPADDPSRATFRAAWAEAATFGALLSVAMSGGVVLARSCLGDPPLLVALCPLVMTAAVLAPFLLPERLQETVPRFVYPLLTLGVLLSPMLVVLTGRSLGLLYPLLAAAGVLRVAPRLREVGWTRLGGGATAALVLAPYLLTEIHRHPFAHVFLPEYALLGPRFLVQDTIFHTSLAHMIQSCGRASRGLDGLVPYPYHVASHAWLGFIGRITGSTPFFVFPFAQATLAVPALLTSALLATVCLARNGGRATVHAAVALALVLVFDALGWTSYYISESQTLGMAVALLGLPLLGDFIDEPERTPGADRLRLVATLGLVFAAIATKVSAGALLGVGFGWALLRRPGGPRVVFLAALGATGLLALWLFQPRNGRSLRESFELFAFFKQMGAERWRGSATLILPVLYLGAALLRRRLDRWREVVLVMTLVAYVPGFLLRLWDSTAWWFWNTMYWIVLPLVASTELPRGRAGRALAPALFLGIVAVALVRFDLRRTVTIAAGLAEPPPGVSVSQFAWEWLTDCRARFAQPIADRLRSGEGTQLLAAVRAATPEDHRGVALFIPPSNQVFWKMDEAWACRRRPSYVPALTGLPLLKGAGPSCPLWVTSIENGFSELDFDALTTPSDDAELCEHARARGVTRVVILESTTEPAKNRVLACPGDGARAPS
jgi:hypothetical protein